MSDTQTLYKQANNIRLHRSHRKLIITTRKIGADLFLRVRRLADPKSKVNGNKQQTEYPC